MAEAAQYREPEPEPDAEAHYHRSRLPGLHCCTLVDAGPPRACVHGRLTLFALTSGEALVWCRGETQPMTPGSVLMLEPGDVHRDLHKTPYRAVMVTVGADLVEALRQLPEHGRLSSTRLSSTVAHHPMLRAATLALVEAVRAGSAQVTQHRLAERLFAHLAPFWTDKPSRTEPPLVARLRRALNESRSPTLSLAKLAQRLRCAPTYLCRVFSEHAGVGPHAYQLQQRLLEAGRLIESGQTVTRAAALTGFSNASHLRRHFQRRFAIAPSRYRSELDDHPGGAGQPPG